MNVNKSPAANYTKHILLSSSNKHFAIEYDLDVREQGFCLMVEGKYSLQYLHWNIN